MKITYIGHEEVMLYKCTQVGVFRPHVGQYIMNIEDDADQISKTTQND